MDQHPIPQDVTGFQFKLIGNMTVKQFAYIAVGVISAVVLYYLPLNTAGWIIFKVFFIPISGATGVIIAFVPIEGRPIDVMAANFSKAIFAPNQYVYHKVGRKFSFSLITTTKAQAATAETQEKKPKMSQAQRIEDQKQHQLQAFLMTNQSRPKNDLDKKEMAYLHTFAPPPPVVATTPGKPTHVLPQKPVPAPLHKTAPVIAKPSAVAPSAPVQRTPAMSPAQQPPTTETLAKQEATLVHELQTAQEEEATTHLPAVHQKVLSLEQQVANIHAQKQKLEQELTQLKNQLAVQKGAPAAPALQQASQPVSQPMPIATPAPQPASYVRNIPQAQTKKAGLPHVSDTPNVVVGIVKDSRGNVLPNMLVEVKDKDSNPVRAFKTNPLGQFASATPLNPGQYTIELEDPKKQHSFDTIQITANNQILLPIEIISHDAREALRQQLFT